MRIVNRLGLPALICLVVAWPGLASGASAPQQDTTAQTELKPLIEKMKENPRGPFGRIRWFCKDGTILPPKSYACADHGGGRQHGEWNADTIRIRDAGFPIANVMVALTEDDFGESAVEQEHFRFLLLEQFLIDADDGWILRRARYYRGAFQIEGEISSAYAILSHLARRPEWQRYRYTLLMEAARLIQHGEETAGQAEVRGMATALNKRDQGFSELRNKIHGRPEPSDAERVRAYAKSKGKPELRDDYEMLAEAIDTVAALPDPAPAVTAYAAKVRDASLASDLRAGVSALQSASSKQERLTALSGLMARLRDGLPTSGHPLDGIDLVLNLESHVFNLGQGLDIDSGAYTRKESVELMKGFARAAYGSGLLTGFEWDNLEEVLASLDTTQIALDSYRDDLRYLDRVPGWAARRLAFYFEPAIEHMAQIEPFVREYIPDRMRGSSLLFYSRLLAPLSADALRLAGVRQQLFGQQVPSGLRVLNPGIGRGVLRTLEQLRDVPEGTANSIALVPETVSELPVVAGILTEHEGNSLSHVQLLARNLGVPNVVVGDDHLPGLREYLGQRILVASSPGGVVRISLDDDSSDADATPVVQERISIDVSRLDLDTQSLIPTTKLGAKDQGVRVGPKAAQVGKLTQHFPGHVAAGAAVPFGLFAHALLEREVTPGGPSLFEWMTEQFDAIQAIQDPVERNKKTAEVLATIRGWFETRATNPIKLDAFHSQLQEYLGPDGSYGVFVRSDTNVEDLPGFTGAGINLTVPNVVGFDNIVAAMRAVWASPFTERSFGWRQGIMNDPEHVYASVLLHKSINSDKSGVLVTADADSGSRDYITIVVNEGVGGGVEGQAAETLLIRRSDGKVRLLGSATDPTKRVLLKGGGSELVAASGAERLLDQQDIATILEFVGELPGWFENLPEEERATAVADVEFGFVGDKLMLFQIRPFVESKSAARSDYLRKMDAGLAEAATVTVNMNRKPGDN